MDSFKGNSTFNSTGGESILLPIREEPFGTTVRPILAPFRT